MATVKRIVCLANSRMRGGRCVAGRELIGNRVGPWIRPVPERPGDGLLPFERCYSDGTEPHLLDIIEVHLLRHAGRDHHTENWLIDPNERWAKVGKFPVRRLRELADPSGPLWVNGHDSPTGRNDRVPLAVAKRLTSSLKLVRVPQLTFMVTDEQQEDGSKRRRVQAQFSLAGVEYHLWVTDPRIEREYEHRRPGEYACGENYLTISLGEPFGFFCYKLVAAVIRAGGRAE